MASQRCFCVVNLGCKVNRAESDSFAARCIAAGARPSSLEEADVVIINTCTVTSEADTKTRKAIRRAARETNCPVIVTGCAAVLNEDELNSLGKRVVVEPLRHEAIQKALEILFVEQRSLQDDPYTDSYISLRACEDFKVRMDIKIQDGCPYECAYCIVTKVRGNPISTPQDKIISQIHEAYSCGVREVILVGVNLGCYFDKAKKTNLSGLVRTILDSGKTPRIRISSIEPMHIDEELADLLKNNPGRLVPHFHIPLQSGSNAVLKNMGRLYTAEQFSQRVGLLYETNPNVCITTDVIVGFPGESQKDFEDSYEFCKEMGFSKIHVFRYSKRIGTVAAEMQDQIDPKISAQRAEKMRKLSDQMSRADMQTRLGTVEDLIVLSGNKAMCESYHDAYLADGVYKRGEIVRARLIDTKNDLFIAEPLI